MHSSTTISESIDGIGSSGFREFYKYRCWTASKRSI